MSYKLDIPWFESPFFEDEMSSARLTLDEKDMLWQYHTEGYIIVDVPGVDIEGIKRDIEDAIARGLYKSQEDGYHYSDSPRIFEAWRWSKPVLDLARNPFILQTLETLYRRKSVPFQTINFVKGSNQPLHSDTIHFTTSPGNWLAGVWVALEDMDCFNGPLAYVPGSHTLPSYDLQDLGLPKPEYGKQFPSYRIYEQFIQDLVKARGLKVKGAHIKAGQALIWGTLLHGGSKILDETRSRWSQASHYFFEGVDFAYSPLFSNKRAGDYSKKDLTQKDILGHVINRL